MAFSMERPTDDEDCCSFLTSAHIVAVDELL
jgi:hypothetical protein